jgi:hypothetical protein
MFDPPKTQAEANKIVYGEKAGNPGIEYDPQRCAYEVWDVALPLQWQCRFKRGHGPAELYCKTHAKMVESWIRRLER